MKFRHDMSKPVSPMEMSPAKNADKNRLSLNPERHSRATPRRVADGNEDRKAAVANHALAGCGKSRFFVLRAKQNLLWYV